MNMLTKEINYIQPGKKIKPNETIVTLFKKDESTGEEKFVKELDIKEEL